MINFRFHLVSLTAVFLALAIGIGVGATVVDRASVDFLQGRLDDVERRRDTTNRENDQLSADVGDWRRFSDQAGNDLVAGAVAGVPVLVVAVEGTPATDVAALRAALARGGVADQGTLWLSGRLKLDSDGDVSALAGLLGITGARPQALRLSLITRLAAQLTAGAEPGLLPALRDQGLVRFEGGNLATVPVPLTRFAVLSGPKPEVANSDLAVPLTSAIATATAGVVVAAEGLGRDIADPDPFVMAVRKDVGIRGRLSTVDNLSDWRGRMATVLAISALTRGVTGHFGTLAGSDRLLPPLGS